MTPRFHRPRRFSWLLLLGFLAAASQASAQNGLVVQGIADAELWATDDQSTFLTRHNGHPAALARVSAWASIRPARTVLFFLLAQAEAGKATVDESTNVSIQQAAIQFAPSPRVVVEAGKLTSPFGSFAARRLSSDNPLIGAPDGYPVAYPFGLMISGVQGRWDYRFGAVSLPVSNERYVGEPTHRLRPAVGAGVTPATGLHLGISFTHGPYLRSDVDSMLPPGARWHEFNQTVAGLDFSLARGYTEIQGEAALSSYAVPGSKSVGGFTAYLDVKHTWSPRVFTALRLEQNDYAFVRPVSPTMWISRRVNFYNGEVGLGYRWDPKTIIKLTYRRDYWTVEPDLRAFLRDGQALAMQVSRGW